MKKLLNFLRQTQLRQQLYDAQMQAAGYRRSWQNAAAELERLQDRVALLQTELVRVQKYQVAYEMQVRRCSR